MESNVKKIDLRVRIAILVKIAVLIALIWYGIKTQRKVWYYLLSIFVIAPVPGFAVFAASGPILELNAAPEEKTETDSTTKPGN